MVPMLSLWLPILLSAFVVFVVSSIIHTVLGYHASDFEKLARELKKRCGSGGTVRDGTIEIQGEHRDTLVEELGRRGYSVKRSGG